MTDRTAYFDLSGDTLPHDLWIGRYEAREGVSRLFEVEVDFSTEDKSFEIDKCLRKSMCLSVIDGEGRTRFFHGIVDRAEYLDLIGGEFGVWRMAFRVVLKPAITALQYRENSRIFQFKSTVDVIKDVFKDAGIEDKAIQWKTFQDYEPRDFCVQYRESEFDFISRLMEEEGLFYFFRHSKDGHKMVISDDPAAFEADDEAPEVEFSMGPGLGGEPLKELTRTRALRTTSAALLDYDFEKPGVAPNSSAPGEDNWPMPLYRYPGLFVKPDAGKRKAKAVLSSRRRDSDVIRGGSNCVLVNVGAPMFIEGGEPQWVNGPFVCIELLSYGVQTQGGKSNFVCRNVFVGTPKDAPWAPPQVTRKPVITGIQTAVVTGSDTASEGIHTDKYGRIKVRFFWDRVGQQNHNSSCWLRVQHMHTGGSLFLPRIGWEVAVTFLEGDPDRPVALGRIYNGEQPAPYALPGAKASGSIKSMSTPGGAGHNEIKMGDSGGGQGHGFTAQKDLNISIGNDKTEDVGVDEEHNVKVNMARTTGGNETYSIGANQTVTIGAQRSNKVKGNQDITVGAVEIDNAISNYVEKIGGNRSYTVGATAITVCNGVETKGTGGITRTVGAVELRASVFGISDNITGAYNETIGAVKLELVKGTSAETVAGMKNQTSAAAEIHLTSGKFTTDTGGMTTQLVGGLHYEKIGGDFSVKAPMITLIGAVGAFKGGSSDFKLGGGPVLLKGSKIAVKAMGMFVKMGSSLKLGA